MRLSTSVVSLLVITSVAALSTACSSPNSRANENELKPGAKSVSQPIIGGTTASTFPEAVLINMSINGQQTAACSGSIIAPRVVLTAGHCVAGVDGWRVTAPFAGNQAARSSSATTLDYVDDGSENVQPNHHDIGLIFLDQPIHLSSYPQLATSALPDGSSIINIGRIQDGQLSDSALFTSRPLSIEDATRQGYPYDYVASEIIESGDSGGPDEVPGTTPHLIVAVNSGSGSGTEVLARVDLVSDFIQQQIAQHGGPGGPSNPSDAGPPSQPTGPQCNGGTSEVEPNDDYTQAMAISPGVLCGNIDPAADQDWFKFTLGAGDQYQLQLATSDDAQVNLFKETANGFAAVSAQSATLISHASSGGNYVGAVYSPGGHVQGYTLTFTR